jgi:DNA polymerase I
MIPLPRPSEEHVAEYFRTMNERHAACLRRAAGEPWPWSRDPIIANWRLTNVFRELDALTLWIAQHWRTPYDGDPRLPFFMCVARQINTKDTLAALAEVGLPPDWNPDRVLALLQARMARGEPTYTSPYRTAIPRQAGDDKSRYLVQEVFDPLWHAPPAFETARSLEEAWHLLTPRRGFGGDGFIAYEVCCDLRHAKLLADAPDVRSWAVCGPGAAPGLDAIWGQKLDPAQRLPAMRYLLDLAPRYVGAHMPALELREIEHWSCEFRKILQVRAGTRPERYRYHPPGAARTARPVSRSSVRSVTSVRSVSSVIAAATRQGVRFRSCQGDELETDGRDRLSAPDRARLEQRWPEILEALREPDQGDPEAILEALDIQVELIEDMARADAVVRDLPPEVGLDLETIRRGPLEQPWLVITKDGRRAVRQPTPGDAPLDPFRGQPRLISIYDPDRQTTFIFDLVKLGGCPAGLLERRVVGHNLLFDLAMLGAQGLALKSSIDTLQLAAMHLPQGQRGLTDVAKRFLGLELPKSLATSNWAAPELSSAQLAYAGADPAVAYRAGKRMYAALEERSRPAFALANRAVPVIVRMRLRGLPFDPATHRGVLDGWQREFAARREEFEQITGGPAPMSSNAVRAWLTERLSDEARQRWPRTERGDLLRTEPAEIKKMALDWPEVRPLLALRHVQKRIEAFGHGLIELARDGRLHGDYSLPMATGRMSCSRPNLQNLPTDARVAVRAEPGKRLLLADLNQIELRVAAELSGDTSMQFAFAAGEDLHDRFARMLCPQYDTLPEDSPERALQRKRAKAGHFGTLFAQTPKGFRDYAWAKFDLELSLEESAEIQTAFYRMYPAIRSYQEEQHRRGRFGVLYSIAGRPRRARWQPNGFMWLQLCANYAIQASAPDVLLEALYRVDRELPDTLVAAVHDELLLEVDEDQAERASKILDKHMTEAFLRWFPRAPILGLVKIKNVAAWAGEESSTRPPRRRLRARPLAA